MRHLYWIIAASLPFFGAGCKAAELDTAWDQLKICVDHNLATLIRSQEQAATVYATMHVICSDSIDYCVNAAMAEFPSKNPYERFQAKIFFRQKLDQALFAYTVKFKAVGGPTSLQPNE